DGVILLAATNRPDILDPALLRPGRFDRQIVVDMPDVKGREQILRVHTRKIPLVSGVDLERIARGTPGLAGAELSNIVNEGARLARAYGGRGAEGLVFGPEKVRAGEAQDIPPGADVARRMVTQYGMSDTIGPIALGDREAEIFLGREVVQRREISERTAELVDTELKRVLGAAYERARQILLENRATLDRVAAALLERETLDREEVELVVAGKPLPPVAPPPPAPAAPSAEGTAREKTPAARGPVLGSPPPEPAGA